MIPFDIVASCSLSLAIALSWGSFRPIFSHSADEALLRSPVTTLASAICLTSFGMALDTKSIGLLGLVPASGLLLGVFLDKSSVNTPKVLNLGLAGALLVFYLSITA